MFRVVITSFLLFLGPCMASAQTPITRLPLFRTVDLNIGETVNVILSDKSVARVKLLDLKETRDVIRNGVRRAVAKVQVNGKTTSLVSANYRLPQRVGDMQIDCPITKGYRENANRDVWGLVKDARIRLWPAKSPLIAAGTFVYPAKQRWFASMTQMANEPVYVDGGERPFSKRIYYHWGLDIGGAEGMIDVVAATDGLVVSSGTKALPGFAKTPVSPRYDVIYILDDRGWYYRYSHLLTIEKTVKPGARVKAGDKIGVLGKEGGSGGWSHLHFDITSKQPSGRWGIQEGFAFLWESYQRERRPDVLAVARPHHFGWSGDVIELDGSRSWAKSGKIKQFEWTFTDGKKAEGSTVKRTYTKPGSYSEILKVIDASGRVDYDFAVVQILDKSDPKSLPPTIHAAYSPTFDIKPGDPVTFKVRTFRTTDGEEVWDFGDGSPNVTVRSDGNVKPLAKDGYAVTTHQFANAGHYIVRVQRTNKRGETATAHLNVRVGTR